MAYGVNASSCDPLTFLPFAFPLFPLNVCAIECNHHETLYKHFHEAYQGVIETTFALIMFQITIGVMDYNYHTCYTQMKSWLSPLDKQRGSSLDYLYTNEHLNFTLIKLRSLLSLSKSLRVRTVAKRHMRYSMFTASFILVSCVKLP